MDKNLHDDIGDLFYDGIEPLSQPPRKEVWENIEQQLDKKDAAQYKQKFITARRMSVILLFLLIGFITCTLIYFNNKKTGNETSNRLTGDKKFNDNNVQQPANINADVSSSLTNNNRNKETNEKNFLKISSTNDNDNNKQKTNTGIVTIKGNINNNKPADVLTESNTVQNGYYIIPENLAPLPLKNSAVNDTSSLEKIAAPVFKTAPATQNSQTNIAKNNTASKNVIKKNTVYHGFFLSFFAAPEKVFYHLKNGVLNPYDNKELIQNREKQDISFSTGILLGYAVNKRFTLQSGIGFSTANTNIAPSKIYAEKNNSGNIKYRYNTSTGYGYILPSFSSAPAVGDSLSTARADQTIQYINVPLIAKYKFGNRKFTVAAGAGVSINFLTKAKLNTEVVSAQGQQKESITKLEGMKKIYPGLILAPELQYNPSKKIILSAAPFFKYALAPANKGNIVKTYPYSIGLAIGITYKLE